MKKRTKERIALNVLFFLSGLCFSTWASRIPDIKDSFDFSDSELGAVLLVRPVGALFALPLSGVIVDKFGSKLSSTAGILLFSLGLALLGSAATVPFLLGSLLIFGIAANLINISNNAQALLIQNKYGKVIMSSFHGLWSLAGFCGAGLGVLALSAGLATATHFYLVSGAVIISLLMSYPFLNNERDERKGNRKLWKKPNRQLLVLGGIAFCGLLSEGCMFDWSAVYFEQVIGAEEGLVVAGYMAFMGMMATGRFVSDYFTNRFGSSIIIQASGLLIFMGLLVAVLFPYLITGIIGFLLVGAGTSSVIPLTFTLVGQVKGFTSGIALATVSTIGYFGFLSGPPLIGFIADLLSLRASFTLVALVGLAITAIVILEKRRGQLKNTGVFAETVN
ncbi:MFS transporter [Nafulsella turpanensis]|uniref:MFS transporter n=1 Tax=Nafulsella turpanensis TaxID=1265690 RepID=UPI00034AAA53|nr:MFS transporter [Nafulsella turpanensis]